VYCRDTLTLKSCSLAKTVASWRENEENSIHLNALVTHKETSLKGLRECNKEFAGRYLL